MRKIYQLLYEKAGAAAWKITDIAPAKATTVGHTNKAIGFWWAMAEMKEPSAKIDGVQRVMPREAPPLDNTLVETQLEVCWGTYKSTVDGTNVKMWCPCVVKRVADGETDKGRDGQYFSARAKKLAPRGMVLVEWEPDPDRGETEATLMWLLLDPRAERSGGKWNGDSHRAWRFHPAELKKRAEQREAPESPDKHMR